MSDLAFGTRLKLPNRRAQVVMTLPHPGLDGGVLYDVAAGYDPAAPGLRLMEVFITAQKTQSAMGISSHDLGTAISIALQYGAPLAVLAGAMARDEHGNPQGIAGAVLDELVKMEGK